MTLSTDTAGSVTIVALAGDVMGGPDGTLLHERLSDLKHQGVRQVVVDLSGVGLMNSSGLGMLIGGLTTLQNAGGDLRLAQAGERVAALLKMTKLDRVFKIFPSVDAAVASFAA